ncbi:hypothetical protein GGR50DRAFT_682910 [Xylaria sp. CBS 124048]|nr:hypothetical protein GGR50DRAFT_682910 [Xylaria sp. CBS 124048]
MARRNGTPVLAPVKPTQNPTQNSNATPDSIPTSSPLSSLNSYTTASATTPSPNGIWEGGLIAGDNSSVIVTKNAHDGDDDGLHDQSCSDTQPRYYQAKRLPPELKEHCRVYLEEALPRQAIFLLDSLLSNRSSNRQQAAYCPPPSQISLLCSIVVHPDFTTRPKESDWPQISLQALVYLQDLLAVFGPINAGFKEAVLFGSNATSNPNSPEAANNAFFDDDQRGLVRLAPRYGTDSVWHRSQDFFRVVGWAFNCSVLSPLRWQWWCRWLEFMLDLLEQDLMERHRFDMETGSDDLPTLRSSILASYLNNPRCGRILDTLIKALFADGSTTATSVFQEVWPRECKVKRRSQDTLKKRKRDKIDIDKGEYGGYLDDESQPSEPPTPQKLKSKAGRAEQEALEMAYIETVPLRQRLFSWVSYLCFNMGDDLAPIRTSDLYEKFAQRVKELPLALFSAFINTSASMLRVDQQIEMLQNVIFLLIAPGALHPRRVDRAKAEQGAISPAILERCFLPYAAGTIQVEDNVKMSLLLENLLMIVWQHSTLDETFSDDLLNVVVKGIDARRDKVNKKKIRGRPKVPEDEELEARAALETSSERLEWLAEVIAERPKVKSEDYDDNMVDEDGTDY